MIKASLFLCCAIVSLASSVHAQISDGFVKIGIMNDQSGPLSSISGPGSVTAARMAVDDFGGKVLGAPIDIVVADHQNKTDVGSTIARTWFDVNGVDVIADIANSGVSLAVQEIGRAKSKVILHVGSGTDRLYGSDCSETGFMWLYDSYAVAQALVGSLSGDAKSTWFFISADYAASKALETQLTPLIEAKGGKVLGVVRHPLGSMDFASYLLQAQSSGAAYIALLNTGADTSNTIKQAGEFGLTQSGQSLVGTTIYLQTVHGLGLATAKGLKFITSFYWDRTPETRAFAQRFKQISGTMPSQVHAGVYSATLAYLRAVEKAGTDEGKAVSAKLKEAPVQDFFAEGASVRADGRLMNDNFLVEVKQPEESKGDWDYYKILKRMKAADVIRPLDAGGCPLVAK
jgi:branched-chain amino acid transport system substrate-binding protein